MPLQRLQVRPGINTQFTPALNEGGWSSGGLIRFRDGLPEKLGGWQHLCATPVTGTARGLHAWDDLAGVSYLAIGSEQRLQVMSGGQLFDITPLRATATLAAPFSTVAGSRAVTVQHAAHGALPGDWIVLPIPVAAGGLVLAGAYRVATVLDANHYTILAASAAPAATSNAGATPLFATTAGATLVTVSLANHGLATGGIFTVQGATAVGGLTLAGDFIVNTVPGPGSFTIIAGQSATATASGGENGGNAEIQYLLPTGASAASAAAGFGSGSLGQGSYGAATGLAAAPLRQWFLDNWGEDLVGCPSNGALYLWAPPISGGNPAAQITQAPRVNAGLFVAMPQQILVSLGAETGGTQDPNLVRWSDAGDLTDWTASVVNEAGSFRIPKGSRIVGGLQGPQQGLIWTDVDLWAMQYVQPPFVFGFTEIADGCGLIAARAAAVLGERVAWMSQRAFFVLDGGGVRRLPCTVWDAVFRNLDPLQTDKIFAAANSMFNEVAWFFPSAAGSGEVDSYVKVNFDDGAWDYGALARTAWTDQSVLGAPIGVDGAGLVQQHESGYDADGAAMTSFAETGFIALADGTLFVFIDWLIPDFVLSAGSSVALTVKVVDYPGDSPRVHGPFAVTAGTEFVSLRARGRYAALRIESSDPGAFWRLGALSYRAAPDGRR